MSVEIIAYSNLPVWAKEIIIEQRRFRGSVFQVSIEGDNLSIRPDGIMFNGKQVGFIPTPDLDLLQESGESFLLDALATLIIVPGAALITFGNWLQKVNKGN